MKYKILIFALALFLLINAVSAIDSTNWTTATVGYENFKIPPEYENPYSSDFHMYEYDEDIDVFHNQIRESKNNGPVWLLFREKRL